MYSKIKGIGNKENFNRLAGFAIAFFWGGLIMQAISAITEGYGIFTFLGNTTGSFIAALVFAVIVVIAWELVIRSGTIYSTKTIIQWTTGKLDFNILELVLVIFAVIIVGGLAYFSKNVSKENSQVVFRYFSTPPPMADDSTAIIEANQQIASIEDRHRERVASLMEQYRRDSLAKEGLFNTRARALSEEVAYWKKREKDLDKKFTYQIRVKQREMDQIFSDKRAALDSLSTSLAINLGNLSEWRDQQERSVESRKLSEIEFVGKANSDKLQMYEAWIGKYSVIWADFAGWTVILAILFIIFQTIFKELADIEEEIVISPTYYETPLLADLSMAAESLMVIPTRNIIRQVINSADLKPIGKAPTSSHPTSSGRPPTTPEPIKNPPSPSGDPDLNQHIQAEEAAKELARLRQEMEDREAAIREALEEKLRQLEEANAAKEAEARRLKEEAEEAKRKAEAEAADREEADRQARIKAAQEEADRIEAEKRLREKMKAASDKKKASDKSSDKKRKALSDKDSGKLSKEKGESVEVDQPVLSEIEGVMSVTVGEKIYTDMNKFRNWAEKCFVRQFPKTEDHPGGSAREGTQEANRLKWEGAKEVLITLGAEVSEDPKGKTVSIKFQEEFKPHA